MVAPDSAVAVNGISKSKKIILNKTRPEDVFFFYRSKYLFDYLRERGYGSVDAFLNEENKFRVTAALKTVGLGHCKQEKY